MASIETRPTLLFGDMSGWREQLAADGASHDGVRLQLLCKGSAIAAVRCAQALDEALCGGWIDGQSKSMGSYHFLVGFSPRRARRPWSKINRDHVARLIDEGRMRNAGGLLLDAVPPEPVPHPVLHRGVTRAETSAAEIAAFIDILERGETIHPQKAARIPSNEQAVPFPYPGSATQSTPLWNPLSAGVLWTA